MVDPGVFEVSAMHTIGTAVFFQLHDDLAILQGYTLLETNIVPKNQAFLQEK